MTLRGSEKTQLTIMSLVVGVLCGLAAVLLHKLIELVQKFVAFLSPAGEFHWLYLALPGVGMLLSMIIVRYFIKDNIGHGVTKVLVAVSKNESRIKPHNTWSSILTSALTIGFGGSVGAEAPIVYTGAAIGSNIGRICGMSYRNITTLLGCGAAAAVAGIFKAPLAGVIFTMEILLFNISMSSMLPLLLSTVSATMIAYLFSGTGAPFSCSITPFGMRNIPFYLILGTFCGFVSTYFIRMTLSLEDKFASLKNSWLKLGLCAAGLGLLIFLFPQLYGEGYSSLRALLVGGDFSAYDSPLGFLLRGGWGVPAFFLMVMLLKVFSMTLTNAGGGVGGTFGPSLFIGAIGGFVVARSLNLILVHCGLSVPEQNFVLSGMAGVMAGVMQAPMTAIFLIAEITGGYDLFLPLILTSATSYGVTRIFEKYSIYTKRIAQSGELLTHDSDQAMLTLLKTSDLVRDKYPRIQMDDTLGNAVQVISGCSAAVFPVLDSEGRFQGQLDMDNIRKYLLRTDQYKILHVYNIMEQPLDYVYVDEPMESVMKKFDTTDTWRLPVIDSDRKYLGYISKSRILMAYRDELKEFSQD